MLLKRELSKQRGAYMSNTKMLAELLDGMDELPFKTGTVEAEYLISNGVTIPVRCKDCKHCIYLSYACGDVRCGKLFTDYIREDSFCSYGERREA